MKDYTYTVYCEEAFFVYVICSCLVIFFVDLLFEMRNSEGISQSSFYTDSYIQKFWSWRL